MKLDEPTPATTGDSPPSSNGRKGRVVQIVVYDPEPPSPIRGLLPPPPEVVEIVNRELAKLPASPKYRQWMLDYLSMDYYFGGYWIAYRDTDQGAEVLAVGLEEMGKLRSSLSPEGREGIIWRCCEPWPLPKSTEQRSSPLSSQRE